jgi:hypothetical protein
MDPDLPLERNKSPNNDDLELLRNILLYLFKGWEFWVGDGAVKKSE